MAVVRPIADEAGWLAWRDSRPELVRQVATDYPPDRLYLMKSGHRSTIHGYGEDGTVTCSVTGEYNLVVFERNVFGVDPAELVECEPPGLDEQVGVALTEPDEIEAHVAVLRKRYLRTTREPRKRSRAKR